MNPMIHTGVHLSYKIINAEMMPLLVWQKGTLANYNKITSNFSLVEFECPCSKCSENFIAIPFVVRLQSLRDHLRSAITITSGYRCKWYQNYLRENGKNTAKKISQHELGNAVDIMCDDTARLNLLAPQYFKAIGNGSSWIHVDGRKDKVRRWKY